MHVINIKGNIGIDTIILYNYYRGSRDLEVKYYFYKPKIIGSYFSSRYLTCYFTSKLYTTIV